MSKKCKICGEYKRSEAFPVIDYVTKYRRKVCIHCNPVIEEIKVPDNSILYICGYYDAEMDQRYLKFGYTIKTVQSRIDYTLKSWMSKSQSTPYVEVLLETHVDANILFQTEQHVLKELHKIYNESMFHNALQIAGYKETFRVESKDDAHRFVKFVESEIAKVSAKRGED